MKFECSICDRQFKMNFQLYLERQKSKVVSVSTMRLIQFLKCNSVPLQCTVYRHAYIVKILDFGFRAFFQKFERFLDETTSFFLVFSSKIQFSDTADHVGIVRSSSGNLPHILNQTKFPQLVPNLSPTPVITAEHKLYSVKYVSIRVSVIG